MRIIGGHKKGTKLTVPDTSDTRPTKDRIRESIFNILCEGMGYAFHKKRVLDIFAGSGSLGLEAFSRGASQAAFVENLPVTLKVLQQNICKLGAQPNTHIIKKDALKTFTIPNPDPPYDFIFLDPPYEMKDLDPLLCQIIDQGWSMQTTLFIIEKDQKTSVDYTKVKVIQEKTYGRTTVLFAKPC